MNHLFDALLPADRDPHALCVLQPDGTAVTYGAMRERSAAYAARLAQLGVGPGDRVAVQVEKSLDALHLYLGCLRVGAAFLPLNTAYVAREIDYFLRDAEPALFVADPAKAAELADMSRKAGVPRFETLGARGEGSLPAGVPAQAPDWRDAERAPDDLATILYTSGTTGRSKGAMLTHANLRSNAEVLARTWRWSPDDVLIHALPIFHAHGLFVGTNVTLLAGASMIFLPRFDGGEILSWMPRASAMMGVPTFYTRLLASGRLDRETAGHMRVFISGSAPLLAETHAAFETATGQAILERYGMTETSMNTSNPYDGPRVPGSVGLPLEGTQVRVVDRGTGVELPVGEIGGIELKGPNVFPGYWRMPERTAAEFRADGYFITGDLGRFDQNGYLFILGRAKDLVISGGYNVYPKEIEEEIDLLPGVSESAVIGVPHPDLGEAVVAVVVAREGASPSEGELVAALRPRLAAYKLPKRIVFVPELPRNTMAKVQKNQLREAHRSLFGQAPGGASS